ncbi:hypothetical protein DSO57_1012267 [Entomophthora muscae]|uniref:Uncharacterized protein n=1 Tax=Entomophthora muscae TaxID=34485 RepID=A0ACC2RWZ0_9FUNG|nr:hypothetical protein DSO57_1012267 [Entomophthora muscae]
MREFNNLMNKESMIGTAKKQKKTPVSQINETYPVILDLLQQGPKLPLTQVPNLFAHHGIWVPERMVQLWMYRKVASVLVLASFNRNQWDGSEASHMILSSCLPCRVAVEAFSQVSAWKNFPAFTSDHG